MSTESSTILISTLNVNDAINWDSLKDHSDFPKPTPTRREPPKPAVIAMTQIEPKLSDAKYQPKLTTLDHILTSRKKEKEKEGLRLFDNDKRQYLEELKEVKATNEAKQRLYEAELREAEDLYKREMQFWEQERQAFFKEQKQRNAAIDQIKNEYFSGAPEAIIDYCEMVLLRSDYPSYFPKNFDLEYDPVAKILIVDYSLPSLDDIPKIKEVKYIQTRDEFTEVSISESERNKLYDNLLYQMALRTNHELYESDSIEAIHSIVLNGWVKFINKATGFEETSCILSLQTERAEFVLINLANVDPKTCFKGLKGVATSKLHSLTAIPPILSINREDKRFVASYDVSGSLDNTTNLAAMHWEDFEHLIRELFEKEFAQSGGEVKITQASRDGGVDVVAFDPDPIRGGKIVIQAKRYTNVVGVSAVRDLYGTVLNEGATKGILVTTATYGPDAYEFAKGKPLTLLNGSNLLHLLERHGHKAKIDLKEAKRVMMERDRANNK
jgi:restriction system protein